MGSLGSIRSKMNTFSDEKFWKWNTDDHGCYLLCLGINHPYERMGY
jgi:hypothetical protein